MTDDQREITVYYNSACPVCNAGIISQKAKAIDCRVRWQDVHTDENARREIAPELELVRERLRVVDEYGNVNVGVEAFETIWRHAPHERWKAKLISLPGIKQIATILYNIFARLLYKWNRWMGHW